MKSNDETKEDQILGTRNFSVESEFDKMMKDSNSMRKAYTIGGPTKLSKERVSLIVDFLNEKKQILLNRRNTQSPSNKNVNNYQA